MVGTRQFEVAEDSGGGAADVIWIVLVCQRGVESAEGAFALFVVFESVDGGDPGFDGRVGEFLDDVEEVFA